MEKRWGEGERVSQTTEHSDLEEIKNPHSSVGKESACSAGDLRSIPGLGRSPGERNGNPLQYSCLENLMDRGTWQATIHGVARVRHDLGTKERKRERNRADNIGYIIWQNPIGN